MSRPRARGGHPDSPRAGICSMMSSPRSRVSSSGHTEKPARRSVVPALAGVIHTASAPAPTVPCRPRARGGHPGLTRSDYSYTGSSPRSRGSSFLAGCISRRPGVVPALAGVILFLTMLPDVAERRPRARGGHPSGRLASHCMDESSPRSRGSSPFLPACAYSRRVVPALAGVIPSRGSCSPPPVRRPRARGGHPATVCAPSAKTASSPRSRGSSVGQHRGSERRTVVPALAGVIRSPATAGPRWTGRPRARGGHPHTWPNAADRTVSSPRSRGSSHHHRARPPGPGVVPALAGVIPARMWRWRRGRSRPRARGSHPPSTRPSPTPGSSSPRSRGSSRDAAHYLRVIAVVPALAGVIRRPSGRATSSGCRPRARGGHPLQDAVMGLADVSSPRSRGSSPGDGVDPGGVLVVPALAGVIPGSRGRPAGLWCRPRERGTTVPPFVIGFAMASV